MERQRETLWFARSFTMPSPAPAVTPAQSNIARQDSSYANVGYAFLSPSFKASHGGSNGKISGATLPLNNAMSAFDNGDIGDEVPFVRVHDGKGSENKAPILIPRRLPRRVYTFYFRYDNPVEF